MSRPHSALPRASGLLVLATALAATGLEAQEADGLTTLERARVERMLENRYACRGCHVIAGRGGLIGFRCARTET